METWGPFANDESNKSTWFPVTRLEGTNLISSLTTHILKSNSYRSFYHPTRARWNAALIIIGHNVSHLMIPCLQSKTGFIMMEVGWDPLEKHSRNENHHHQGYCCPNINTPYSPPSKTHQSMLHRLLQLTPWLINVCISSSAPSVIILSTRSLISNVVMSTCFIDKLRWVPSSPYYNREKIAKVGQSLWTCQQCCEVVRKVLI